MTGWRHDGSLMVATIVVESGALQAAGFNPAR